MNEGNLWRSINGSLAGAELGDTSEADELMETTRRLRAALRPVEPSPLFRAALRHRLLRAAGHERGHVHIAMPNERTREVLVGAAVLSVVGALMYLWRIRGPQGVHQTSMLLDSGPAVQKLPSTAA